MANRELRAKAMCLAIEVREGVWGRKTRKKNVPSAGKPQAVLTVIDNDEEKPETCVSFTRMFEALLVGNQSEAGG